MKGINYDTNDNYPLSITKDFHSLLSLPLSASSSRFIKIATWKDERLEYLDIPKGLVEVLQTNGFTIEKILDSCPADIAEKLGIDFFVGEIIFNETKKAISKINPDLLLINK
jgi:hypothetical protein